jgi:hypothetical protein
MCKLRALELFNFELNDRELEAILDTCPLLESLHVTGFCSFIMEKMCKELLVKYSRVKNVTLPSAREDEDYYSYVNRKLRGWGQFSDDEFN